MTKRMKLWLQLPEAMRLANRWLVSEVSSKRPVHGRADHQKDWLSFEQATLKAHPCAEDVAISFVAGDGWVCVDIDNQHITGSVANWVWQMRPLSYVEHSPNNGLHIWYQPGDIIQLPQSIRCDVWATRKHVICTGRKL